MQTSVRQVAGAQAAWRRAPKIIGPSVIGPLLTRYEKIWGFRWPYERDYLAELVIEAKAGLGMEPNNKTRAAEVCEDALVLMRETHSFEDFPPPFGSGEPAGAHAAPQAVEPEAPPAAPSEPEIDPNPREADSSAG